jgi:hypothetical protein
MNARRQKESPLMQTAEKGLGKLFMFGKIGIGIALVIVILYIVFCFFIFNQVKNFETDIEWLSPVLLILAILILALLICGPFGLLFYNVYKSNENATPPDDTNKDSKRRHVPEKNPWVERFPFISKSIMNIIFIIVIGISALLLFEIISSISNNIAGKAREEIIVGYKMNKETGMIDSTQAIYGKENFITYFRENILLRRKKGEVSEKELLRHELDMRKLEVKERIGTAWYNVFKPRPRNYDQRDQSNDQYRDNGDSYQKPAEQQVEQPRQRENLPEIGKQNIDPYGNPIVAVPYPLN